MGVTGTGKVSNILAYGPCGKLLQGMMTIGGVNVSQIAVFVALFALGTRSLALGLSAFRDAGSSFVKLR